MTPAAHPLSSPTTQRPTSKVAPDPHGGAARLDPAAKGDVRAVHPRVHMDRLARKYRLRESHVELTDPSRVVVA